MGFTVIRIPRVLILIVVFLGTTTFARPMVLSGMNNTLNAQVQSLTPSNTSPSTSLAHNHTPPTRDHVLYKRMFPNGPSPHPSGMRMNQVFGKVVFMTPITHAAKYLEGFFSSIAIKADPNRGEWSTLPPKSVLTIQQGGFQLAFNCIGDTIPWSFVKDFAENMWEAAVLGFPHLFETIYRNAAGSIAVQITLSLIEDSTGSNSAQDWREGSVPSINSGDPYGNP